MKLALASLALVLPGLLAAQSPASPAAADAGAKGRVVDSLVTGGPLAGAEIWLDGAPTGAATDSAGRYWLPDVPAGWHTISFSHPALDTLGVSAPPVRVELAAPDVTVHLATPSAATLHLRACGARPAAGEGILVGLVEHADDGRPAPGATVEVAWLEWTVAKEGLEPTPRTSRVNADASGRYALCFVPADVVVGVSARAGEHRSGTVDAELGGTAFTVRRLIVGRADAVVTGGVRDTTGRPVPGARASVVGAAAEAVGDSLGEFRLTGVPAGSQTIEVRAVGFSPVRVPVVARPSRPAHLQVTVGRMQMLPTIAVVGRQRPRVDATGFEERRARGHSGYFLTQEDIRKRRAMSAIDVFRGVPGIRVQTAPDGKPGLVMPRAGAGCQPTVYLDGMVMMAGALDLNTFVRAYEIQAVEVYSSFATVPNDFRVQNSTCGVVLLWTRTR